MRVLLAILGLLIITLVQAEDAPIKLLPIDIDLHDQAKLQRGARLFMNYCSGCHSLRYLRYNRMAYDLGLTTFDGQLDEDLLTNNLIFTQAKVVDPIRISMPATDARQWFGKLPPDLSLVAREYGSSWLYTYLSSFYKDNSQPFKSNNLLVPGVAMPNVLAPLSGEVIAVHLSGQKAGISHLVRLKNGEMNEQEFASALQDLVTFLVYVGEPAKLVRYRIGGFVIAYLCIFLIVAYQLKKSWWKKLPS